MLHRRPWLFGVRALRRAVMLGWLLAALGFAGPVPAAQAPGSRAIDGTAVAFRCPRPGQPREAIAVVATRLAGVPAVVRVPRPIAQAPIVLWHGFGAPASEHALMDALPLDDVPAVKVYLGLPLFGARAPAGGNRELARRQARDFAMQLFKPVVVGAADELPAVVASLRRRGCLAAGQGIGLFGFSGGGAAALVALLQRKVKVDTAVLVNASTGLNASVDALQRALGTRYAWTPAARALARQTDAPGHAADIASGKLPPALLIVQGEADNVLGAGAARALRDALVPWYRGSSAARLGYDAVAGMPHGWAGDPGNAATVRRLTADWFRRHP